MKKNAGNPKDSNSNAAALRAAAVAALRKESPKRPGSNAVNLSSLVKAASDEKATWMEANKPEFGFRGPSSEDSEESKLHQFTWDCLNEPMSPHFPQPGTTWRDYAPEVLHARLEETLRHLTHLADSDTKAIGHLVEFAVSTTEFLNDMSPEKLRPVGQRSFLWPFLEAKKGKSSDRDKHKRLVEAIQLGRDVPFSEKAFARISTERPASIAAVRLLCRLEHFRKPDPFSIRREYRNWQQEAYRLQPFSQHTSQKWAEVAIESLFDDHNGHPENDPLLRKIGQSAAKHSERQGAQKQSTPKTEAANIRQRIRDAIKDVIRTLAGSHRKQRRNAA